MAPVSEGQKAGVVKVYAGDELVGEYDAVTMEGVEEGGLLSILGITDDASKTIRNLAIAILGVLLLLTFLFVLIKRKHVRNQRLIKQRQRQRLRGLQEREKARWDEEYWRTRNY
jgi:serine-type D-Ala-D-Ala carboxypeptidase (penicillin-binding protein 5/6)